MQVGPVQTVLVILVRMVGLADVAEVRERVAEGGELPVQDCDDARLGGMHDGIAEPVVPVHHHRLGGGGNVPREPLHQRVHLRNVLGAGRNVLLAPARDLALVVVAGPAEGLEPDGRRRDRVEGGEDLGEMPVDSVPLSRRRLRHEGVREHAAVHLLHHVELRADDLRVLAQQVHPGDGHRGRAEGLHDPVLAVDLVSGGEELARGLLAKHELPVAGLEQERRIALPTFELPDLEPAPRRKVGQLRSKVTREGTLVEAMSGPHRRHLGNVAHVRILIG